jgi:hypothetical protein
MNEDARGWQVALIALMRQQKVRQFVADRAAYEKQGVEAFLGVEQDARTGNFTVTLYEPTATDETGEVDRG